ncbi:hypothetical protein CEUSTIGMA_g5261.t1 [Chlamydomonas eustigma]|uniref:SAM-dependent MTase RsmB/NOP-type domain-containing protein n=1 Tax=Chlamydomonas eustigma TaxID=1157962 RepID=A0A250X414_9CHLO|nr:hypothetical protein CEUSTIGMA_g5261.t1 [Chlamydomonas eustigma]|eukprot:GAX77818.1 hypothetical protein CEUSTIGMA_g5261.t1 [Chlamydomonas eustigma]
MPKARRKKGVLNERTVIRSNQMKGKHAVKPLTTLHKKANKVQAVTTVASTSYKPSGLQCHNILHRQAAQAVRRLLAADSGHSKGVSLKSLTLAPHIENKKATYAVTCQVLKYLPVLKSVLEKASLVEVPEQMDHVVAYVLCYELLFGQGVSSRGKAERVVRKHQAEIRAALKAVLMEKGVNSVDQLLSQNTVTPPSLHPRWLRVNLLKSSVKKVVALLLNPDPIWPKPYNKPYKESDVVLDALLPDVMSLPPGSDLHDHPLVIEGVIILQSKASCMPAHALKPMAGWTVVDCCAAPGNKTTHIAALIKAAGGNGMVIAFDRDERRLERLNGNAVRAGAMHIISARLHDFLSVDPECEEMSQVQGIILDPSCSGSGTIYSRMDHLLPSSAAGPRFRGGNSFDNDEGQMGQEETERLERLASFQEAALRHALHFPAVKRLVYSTCSVHQRENEDVVAAVLPEAHSLGFRLKDPFPEWHRRGRPVLEGHDMLVRTDACLDGTDGFFVALFERTSDPT